jgi:small GTP-binding protein
MATENSLPCRIARKVILLGNTGVGKTSLFNRWIYGDNDPDVASTVGASHGCKDIDTGQRIVKVILWDTAGQEQFRSLMPIYVRGARVAIVVAATDSERSLHAIPDWLKMIVPSEEEAIPVLLAVNKSDLRDPWTDNSLRNVIELYESRFEGVFIVSAVTGEQVSQLFQEAARLADVRDIGQPDEEVTLQAPPPPDVMQCC